MKKSEKRVPGRPRAFDKASALEAAIEVFWTAGFANASLDDLTFAMKISRPSLYSAFGDKEALFNSCAEVYGDRVIARVKTVIDNADTGRDALSRIYGGAIEMYTKPAPVPRGCLFAASLLSDVAVAPPLKDAVTQQLFRLEGAMRDLFERFPPPGTFPARAARLGYNTLYGLACRARLGIPAAVLQEDAETFVTLIYPGAEQLSPRLN